MERQVDIVPNHRNAITDNESQTATTGDKLVTTDVANVANAPKASGNSTTVTSSNRRKSGAIMSYLYVITQIVVNLLYVPMLLSTIGRSEYGLFQIVGSLIAYLNIINTTLSSGATRFYAKYKAVGDTDGMANVLGTLRRIYRKAGVIIVLATVVLMPIVRLVYANSFTPTELDESCIMIGILAVNMLLTMENTISIATITANERFVFLKGSMLAALVTQPVIVYVAARIWPSAVTVTAAQLLTNVICCLWQRLYARRRLGMDDRLRKESPQLTHDLLSFSGSIILGLVADQIFWKTDQLILGWMYGTDSTAVYAVGMQVVSAYMAMAPAISSVFLPRISELWHRNHDINAVSQLFVKVSRLSLYPLLAVLIGFIVFGRSFIRLWAGDGYDLAYWVAVIVMIPFTVDVSQNVGLTILQVMNKYGFRTKMYLTAAIINIVGTFVLASMYGGYGAAVATAGAIVVSSGIILNVYYVRGTGLDMSAWWKSTLREALPLVLLGYIAWSLWNMTAHLVTWGTLVVGILLFAICYVVLAYATCMNPYERGLVRGIIDKVRRVARRR